MTYLTISIEGVPDDARRAAIDAVVSARGGRAQWRCNARAGRSYAVVESAQQFDTGALPLASGDVVYEMAVIAWAVFPAVPEALPQLTEAFAGAGRPAGLLACRSSAGGVVLEWDPQRCAARLVLDLVDVELARFNSGRSAQVLAPVPAAIAAKLASDGLATPELAANRILELLIE